MPLSAGAIIAIFGVVVTLPPALITLYRRQQGNTRRQNHTNTMQLLTNIAGLSTANNSGISPNNYAIHKFPGCAVLEAGGYRFLALFSSRSWTRRRLKRCHSLG